MISTCQGILFFFEWHVDYVEVEICRSHNVDLSCCWIIEAVSNQIGKGIRTFLAIWSTITQVSQHNPDEIVILSE